MMPKSELTTLALVPFLARHPVHREELAYRVRHLLDREGLLFPELDQFLRWAPEVPFDLWEGASRFRELLKENRLFTSETDELLTFIADFSRRQPHEREEAVGRMLDYYGRRNLLSAEVKDLLIHATDYGYWRPGDYDRYRRSIAEYASREAADSATQVTEEALRRFNVELKELAETRMSQFEERFEFLRRKTSAALTEHSDLLRTTSSELQSYLWLASCGVDFSLVRTTRYVPARIYITDPVPSQSVLESVVNAIRRLSASLDLEVANEFVPQVGSWFKRFILKTKTILTHGEVTERLGKAEDAIEATYLDKPKAEANKMQAEAASCLISALKDTPHACIQVGSLLLVKSNNTNGEPATVARTLTRGELKLLEENQFMLGRPSEILNWLGARQTAIDIGHDERKALDLNGDVGDESSHEDK